MAEKHKVISHRKALKRFQITSKEQKQKKNEQICCRKSHHKNLMAHNGA
jgi:hypothetical protein